MRPTPLQKKAREPPMGHLPDREVCMGGAVAQGGLAGDDQQVDEARAGEHPAQAGHGRRVPERCRRQQGGSAR